MSDAVKKLNAGKIAKEWEKRILYSNNASDCLLECVREFGETYGSDNRSGRKLTEIISRLFSVDRMYTTRRALYELLSAGKLDSCLVRDKQTRSFTERIDGVIPAFEFADKIETRNDPRSIQVVTSSKVTAPELSVIIPVYNVRPYLKECLDSILRQNDIDLEVVCVDDGSTDGSSEILNEYASTCDRITLIRQPNRGLSVARNVGIDAAKGRFIHFVDSDDCVRQNAYSEAVNTIKRMGLQVLFFNAETVYETEELRKRYPVYSAMYNSNSEGLSCVYSGREYFIHVFLNELLLVPVYLYIFEKSLLNDPKLRFPAGIIYEDNLFTIMLMLKAEHAAHSNAVYYNRRIRNDSVTITKIMPHHVYGYYYLCRAFEAFDANDYSEKLILELLHHRARHYLQCARGNYRKLTDTRQKLFWLGLPDDEACSFCNYIVDPVMKKPGIKKRAAQIVRRARKKRRSLAAKIIHHQH